MKKTRILFCLLSAAALAAVWQHRVMPPREPPDLTATCQNQTATLWRGTYGWQWMDYFGSGQGVTSDSPHPLDVLEELPALAAEAGDRISVSSPAAPDSLTAERFSRVGPDSEALTPQPDGVLLLPEEGRDSVYVIHARWNDTFTGSGNAVYAFYVP